MPANDCDQRTCCDTGDREVIGELQRYVADTKDDGSRDGNEVNWVTKVNLIFDPDLGTKNADHAVKDRRHAAKYAARNCVDDGTKLGAEPEDDREYSRNVVSQGRIDLGCSHDTDIFGVCCGW